VPAGDLSVRTLAGAIRRTELVVVAFLSCAQALARVVSVATVVQYRVTVWNSAIALAYAILLFVDCVKPTLLAGIVRD